MPPGIDLRRGSQNPYSELYRGSVPYKWLWHGNDLIFSDYRNDVPQIGSAVFLEQVDYEVGTVGRRIGGPIEWTGINATARAFKGLKCRFDWYWDDSQEVWTQVLTPGNIPLPLPPGGTTRQHRVFAHPDVGAGVATPFVITASNPDGSASTRVGTYSVSDSTTRPILGIAKQGVTNAHQVPSTLAETARPYFEFRTNAIITRVVMEASDNQGNRFTDQTRHLQEGYVTGTRSGVYNAGYILSSGTTFTFGQHNGLWNPSFRIRIWIEGESDAQFDQSGIRVIT